MHLLTEEDTMPTISHYIHTDSTLTVLADLLKNGGYDDTLGGPEKYTLFAPNNAAFERTNIIALLNDPGKRDATLKYHIVPGRFSSTELSAFSTLETEYGISLTIETEDNGLVIDNARIVTSDIQCSNGIIHIIHIIDNVFQPLLSGYYFHEKQRWRREETTS